MRSESQQGLAVEAEGWFGDYIAAFNRGDRAAYGAYYHDDVVLVIADRRELRGRQAIFDFYEHVRAGTERTIRVLAVLARGNRLAAELESEFLATRDLPDFPSGPMRAGDRLYINSFVFYDLEDGKFRRIRAASHRREFRPAAQHRHG